MSGLRTRKTDNTNEAYTAKESRGRRPKTNKGRSGPRRATKVFLAFGTVMVTVAAIGSWLAFRAFEIKTEMMAVNTLLPQLERQLVENDKQAAKSTLEQLQTHSSASRAAATDPLWLAAGAVPWLGHNFSAVTELALSAVDVIEGAATPVVETIGILDGKNLTPINGKVDLSPLSATSSSIVSAANTVELTHERLTNIEGAFLLSEVAGPLEQAKSALNNVRKKLTIAADASQILPTMLGAEGPRNYLVLVQNNAEVRATGGLSGALAVIQVRDGAIKLSKQSSGTALGKFSPRVPVDPAQTIIYSGKLGAFIGDVNLTPDFPTAAKSAKAMWETRHGGTVDGVVAIDPVVLSHILEASGPLDIETGTMDRSGMPTTLTSENVVQTLLSDAYSRIDSDEDQDAYFASTSQAIFQSLTSGKTPGDKLLAALSRSVEEDRIRVWSNHKVEQRVLGEISLGGSISGPAAGGTAFGVYFNDGTGAKMDYYVRRTVQLLKVCTTGEHAQFTVRVKLTNTAPLNSAEALPKAVTGSGVYGVPPGSVQTNVVIYGPAMAHVDSAFQDGATVSFGSYLHDTRPVGVVTTRLAPGDSSEIEMTFVNVIQHSHPKLSVTPTVQNVKDVMLPTEYGRCG